MYIMMKISLSGSLGSNFKWSGKYGLSFTIPDSPSRNLEPILKNYSTNKKVLVFIQNNNHSIMQFSLGRRKGSKSSTYWCSLKSLCENHQSCDRHRLSPRNRYHTWSLCIRLKEIFWDTNTSKIVCLIYWTRKKKVFSWHVYSYPSSVNNGNETNLALFKSRFSSENYCRWEWTGSSNLNLTTFL